MIKPHATTRGQKTKAHVKYDMRFFLAVRTLLHLRAFTCAYVCFNTFTLTLVVRRRVFRIAKNFF